MILINLYHLQDIAKKIEHIFKQHGVEVAWELLSIDERGAYVEKLDS
jgi:hypothetical protein